MSNITFSNKKTGWLGETPSSILEPLPVDRTALEAVQERLDDVRDNLQTLEGKLLTVQEMYKNKHVSDALVSLDNTITSLKEIESL